MVTARVYQSSAAIALLAVQLLVTCVYPYTEDALCDNVLLQDLPVRYLHIQMRRDGENLTHSEGALEVSVTGDCRFRWEQIDNFDGSYVFRLRLWSPCRQLHISLRSPHGFPLCDSPILLQKENGQQLYPEDWNCAREDLNGWMKSAGCPENYDQLASDLKQWQSIDFTKVLRTVKQTWGSERNRYSMALCHYQIVSNEIYRHCYGEYTAFRKFVDDMLTSVARKMQIPNTEFVFNLGDYPLQGNSTDGAPVVSWCGSRDTMDIVMPTYELADSVLGMMHRVATDIQSAKGKRHWPWDKKKATAVFRGRDSNRLRLELVALSQRRPDLIDAGITRYFFFNESLYATHVEHQPFSNFFQHRFVLSIDGTVAAYRLPFLLAGDSVVFKSESQYYEHFYHALKPDIHYVPFSPTDIVTKLEKAKEQNFAQMRKATKQFVLDHLQPLHVYCHYAQFLKEYTAKLKRPPEKTEYGMEHVAKTSPREPCSCIKQENQRPNADRRTYSSDDL